MQIHNYHKKIFSLNSSQSDFSQCAIAALQRSIFSNKELVCSIPSFEILGLHPNLPYCEDPDSYQEMYYIVIEIFLDFVTHPETFGCRYHFYNTARELIKCMSK